MKKIIRVLAGFALTLTPFLNLPLTSAAVDTCTWSGAVNANWDNVGNWSCSLDGAAVPESGDAVIFPEAASNKSTNNDISSLSLTTLQISGSGYTLAGNSITLTATSPLTINQNATISLNITYAPSLNAFLRVSATQTLTMNGTTTFSGIGGEVNVGGGGFSGTIDFAGNISGTSGSQFIAVSGAKAIVRGASNTYTATTVGAESDGTFECRSTTCFGDNANDIYSGGGMVDLFQTATLSNDVQTSSVTPDDSWLTAYDNVSITGNVTINDSLAVSQVGTSKSLQFTGAVTLNNSMSVFGTDQTSVVRLSGTVTGADGISFGGGTTYLSVANNYSGTNTVNADARVIVENSTSLGATSGITRVLDGGSVAFFASSPITVDEDFIITGKGIGGISAALLNDAAEDVTLTGTITLDGDATVQTSQADSSLTASGIIDGIGDLTLIGEWDSFISGSITIDGTAPNTYDGDTIVTGGIVYFEKTGAIPSNLYINNLTPVTNRSHAYFYSSSDVMSDTGILSIGTDQYNNVTFGANNEVIGGLEGTTGTISIQTSSDRVIIDQDHDSTYAGVFYTDGNPGTVEKRGTGKLTLTGDSISAVDEITYVVTEGTLVVNGDIRTTAGGNVTVTNGTLKGTGMTGAVTMNGGTLAPGNSPGTLNTTTLTLASGSVFQQEIAGNTAGTQYDQVIATGAVNLGNATLSILLSTTPADGTVFTIVSAGSVSGTFNGLPNGSTITVNGIQFRVNYTATTVTLTKIPNTNTTTTSNSLQSTGVGILASLSAGILLITLTSALYRKKSQETTDTI